MAARATTSRPGSGGFTLIEMLMAMLILTVGLLGLLQSIQVAYHQNARNRLRDVAVLLADEQMRDFKGQAFERITANTVFAAVTTQMGGVSKRFDLFRDCNVLGASPLESTKCAPEVKKAKVLTVAVKWTFKNETTTHEIFSVKNNPSP